MPNALDEVTELERMWKAGVGNQEYEYYVGAKRIADDLVGRNQPDARVQRSICATRSELQENGHGQSGDHSEMSTHRDAAYQGPRTSSARAPIDARASSIEVHDFAVEPSTDWSDKGQGSRVMTAVGRHPSRLGGYYPAMSANATGPRGCLRGFGSGSADSRERRR